MSKLRLQNLTIENFRSISGTFQVPLDASVTLVHGANGAGKTSLLSAIEYGATGRVGFLDEQVGDSVALLRNRDFPLGRVRLTLLDEDGSPRVGAFELNGARANGAPALSPADRTYFRERSFLPQTALGRLLESYTDTGKQVDTALVRFVKSLIGLDDLDALIDGLHSAGNVTRTKKLVPEWRRVDTEKDQLESRRISLRKELAEVRDSVEQAVGELRELLGEGAAELDVDALLSLALGQSDDGVGSRSELARLEELRARVDAIASLAQKSATSDIDIPNASGADHADEIERRYRSWEDGPGAAALSALNRIRTESFGLQPVGSLELSDAFGATLSHANELVTQSEVEEAARQASVQRNTTLQQELSTIDADLISLERTIAAIDVPQDVRVLVEILQSVIPLSEGVDFCPICDQHFTGEGTLSEHLALKLNRLSKSSQELLRADSKLRELQSTRLRLVGGLTALPANDERSPSAESLAATIRGLNSLRDVISEGAHLLSSLRSTQVRRSEVSAKRAEQAVITSRIDEVASELGIPVTEVPSTEADRFLAQAIAQRIQHARYGETRRKRERAAIERVEDARGQVAEMEQELRRLDEQIKTASAQLSAADKRMKDARSVLQSAERTRSRLINEVFDQSLNGLWKQLFIRFAPSERFTPRFTKQTANTRSVDVRLETELPNGEVSGSPAAMLSYGNTNSAALSLFMALHLSGPRQLPWLIFDDPVQSMDDIHISNFATIVRQLAYVHDRQVVIAIHQRELFDYLAMELAPSNEGQSLVRLTLDRSAGITELQVDRVAYESEIAFELAGTV